MSGLDLFSRSDVEAPKRVGEYRTIYADPSWLERGGGKVKRGADRHYPLMSTEAICELPVSSWTAADAHLYLWVTNNFFEDGFAVIRAWGFRYVTCVSWFKGDANDERPVESMRDEDLQIGLGQYFRGATEHCLFAVRGMVPYKTVEGKRAQGRTGFHAPRGQHSAKPEKMRAMIERVSTGPFLEMFSRRPATGWDAWGNQAT